MPQKIAAQVRRETLRKNRGSSVHRRQQPAALMRHAEHRNQKLKPRLRARKQHKIKKQLPNDTKRNEMKWNEVVRLYFIHMQQLTAKWQNKRQMFGIVYSSRHLYREGTKDSSSGWWRAVNWWPTSRLIYIDLLNSSLLKYFGIYESTFGDAVLEFHVLIVWMRW